MQANTHTPAVIFGSHVRYVVPLFQRPYVWSEDEQWAPLWEDVRTLAERVLDAPSGYGAPPVAPHFLGAIVLDQQSNPAGFIQVRHVIDGQQRLTTLQLLLDAAQEVTKKFGSDLDAQTLKVLVLNQPQVTQHPDEVFKVWPTDRDQAAFRAAMDNGAVVSADQANSRIALAHAFFVRAITDWAEASSDPAKCALRLKALVQALHGHLKLVVIDLDPGDNAQVIFETLNHRGAPLLAADLVKNLVFQVAEMQHLDTRSLYTRHWAPLDTDYWRELTAQGRLYRPRIDVFLNYWLTMKLLREVPTDRVFTDFRDHVLPGANSLEHLLAELARDAAVYASLDALPAGSVPARFHYRIIQALDTRAITPVLLWILRWSPEQISVADRDHALDVIESWLVRRTLARLTSKNLNQAMLELLKTLAEAGPQSAGQTAQQFLAVQTADSRLWPDDDLVRSSLLSAPAYTAFLRPRLRMFLEALEDNLRSDLGEGQAAPKGLTVEHLLPQHWRENWPLPPTDVAGAVERDRLLHRLGNLTLVSGKLNPVLSNRPWVREGGTGKRDYLNAHSNLNLNSAIVKDHPSAWTESDIRARTEQLAGELLSFWPRPVTAVPTLVDDASKEPEAPTTTDAPESEESKEDSHTGKYGELWSWLLRQTGDRIELTLAQVEEILGLPLPPSSRLYRAHWYGYEGSAVARAIRDAGWKATEVDLADETVTLVRQ